MELKADGETFKGQTISANDIVKKVTPSSNVILSGIKA